MQDFYPMPAGRSTALRRLRGCFGLLVLVLGTLSLLPACVTESALRSVRGDDSLQEIQAAWSTPDGRIEVFLSAALGGDYFCDDYRVTLVRSELETAAQSAPEGSARLVLSRSRLKPCTHGAHETPEPDACVIPAEARNLFSVPDLAEGEIALRNAARHEPGAKSPLGAQFAVYWRDPGAAGARSVTVEFEPDRSEHKLARWTIPIMLPVAVTADVVIVSVYVWASAGGPRL